MHDVLLASIKLKPAHMTRPVLSHCDMHSGNIMKNENGVIMVDYEMANTALGLIDLGALLFNSQWWHEGREHMERERREHWLDLMSSH